MFLEFANAVNEAISFSLFIGSDDIGLAGFVFVNKGLYPTLEAQFIKNLRDTLVFSLLNTMGEPKEVKSTTSTP